MYYGITIFNYCARVDVQYALYPVHIAFRIYREFQYLDIFGSLLEILTPLTHSKLAYIYGIHNSSLVSIFASLNVDILALTIQYM